MSLITSCVNCDKEINIDNDDYIVGKSLGEYWCKECTHTGSNER